MDRKAELERKKAKLAAIREEKERRRREKEEKDKDDATNKLATGPEKGSHRNLDEMLSSLGVAPVSEVLSSLTSVNSMASDTSVNATPDGSLQPASLNGTSSRASKRSTTSLSVVSVQATEIPPKETVTYSKQTQTANTGGVERDGYMEDWWRPRKAHATDYYASTMNGQNVKPPDESKSNEYPHQEEELILNGTEIKQEPDVKLGTEDVGDVAVEHNAASGLIVNLIDSEQTGDTFDFTDVCELDEAKLELKKETMVCIDKKAEKGSGECFKNGAIEPLSSKDAKGCCSNKHQKPSKPKIRSNKQKSTASKRKDKQHKCSSCDYTTSLKGDLNRHIRKHTGEKPFPCTNCEKRFTRKQYLHSHMRKCEFQKSTASTGKDKQYKCSSCDYTTLKKSNLNVHIRKHTGEKPFPCTHCTKRFARKCQHQRHMRLHVSEFLFSCSNCLKGFTQSAEKVKHEISCKIRRIECYLCEEYSTLNKAHLQYHMRMHHTFEKPFGCDLCSKKFPQQSDLKRHRKTHNPRPLKFKCSVCYRNFYQPIERDEHESKCKSPGYECYACKEFTSHLVGHLIRHIRTHTGLKPSQCEVCQKHFTCETNLKDHQKRMHKISVEIKP